MDVDSKRGGFYEEGYGVARKASISITSILLLFTG